MGEIERDGRKGSVFPVMERVLRHTRRTAAAAPFLVVLLTVWLDVASCLCDELEYVRYVYKQSSKVFSVVGVCFVVEVG